MPFPWALAFKVIPWSDVIAAAPGVVRSAQKLWKQSENGEALATTLAEAPPDERVARMEAMLGELQDRLAHQAELASALAEQNRKLVEAVEVLRQRTRVLSVAAAVLAVGVVTAFLTLA